MPRRISSAPPINAVIKLRDGRRLGYSEIGPRSGSPVLYLHGNPGSRKEMLRPGYVAAIEQAGVRVIAIDRPGYGDSDPPSTTGHRPFVDDARELMDHLKVKQGVVVGHSRGTLPAISLGVVLPDRIKAVGVFGPTGLPDDPELLRAQSKEGRLMVSLVKHVPAVAKAMFRINGWVDERFPGGAVTRMSRFILSEADRKQLRQKGPEFVAAIAEGMRRDPAFAIDDWRSWLVDPLGFDPTAITVPLQMWIGLEDGLCPPELARSMAARINKATVRELLGVGHFHTPELLVELMESTITNASLPD